MARYPGPTAAPIRTRRRRSRLGLLMLLAGLACIVAGGVLIGGPLYHLWQRGNVDQSAITDWAQGGSGNLQGPAKSGRTAVTTHSCGSGSTTDYALVKFSGQFNYAGVAGDGDWGLLNTRSMVHYHGTPDPGQKGNSIIAFHREPDFEHIDQMGKGSIITVEDRTCHTFRYQVTDVWTLDPTKVTQLTPTSGSDLTLITCTPWFRDTQRIVWRASLLPS